MIVFAFLVAAALGAVSRFVLSVPLNRRGYPWGTLLVNLTGSLALGLLAGSGPAAVTVAGVGALGAYTTFSTFVVELEVLARRSRLLALSYGGLSVFGAVGAAWLGLALAS